jgi:predicted GH43/DUF377 family glycosyl hydrolase
MKPIFRRSERNPILTVKDLPFHAEAVLNPGAAEVDGQIVLLIRVEDTSGFSNIYAARSNDGITDWEIDSHPILECGLKQWKYEHWGCEDPRISYIAEHKAWYITYTAYSHFGAAVGLAKTQDFKKAERIGLILPPNNKDACLFPAKIHNRWAIVQRPDAGGGIENIWLAYSPDLIHWGEPHCVLPEGHGPAWDAVKVGAGPPPLLTDEGWLLFYHGVKEYAGQKIYRVGAALLDRDKPHKVLARTPRCLFKATEPYEVSGLVPNVVFPTGVIRRGSDLWVYYGAADTCVCLAVVSLERVLSALETDSGPFEKHITEGS